LAPALRAEVERLRPVVEAARVWRLRWTHPTGDWADSQLSAAIDALRESDLARAISAGNAEPAMKAWATDFAPRRDLDMAERRAIVERAVRAGFSEGCRDTRFPDGPELEAIADRILRESEAEGRGA